jgi:hypothetical protein
MNNPTQTVQWRLPDRTDLPSDDGIPARGMQEHPLSVLLTTTIWPRLEKVFPEKQFAIGRDNALYWRLTDPPLDGCKFPDWFLIPGVPPLLLDGKIRRSYVMWQEVLAPLLLLEFATELNGEEYDQTPWQGKFWV